MASLSGTDSDTIGTNKNGSRAPDSGGDCVVNLDEPDITARIMQYSGILDSHRTRISNRRLPAIGSKERSGHV